MVVDRSRCEIKVSSNPSVVQIDLSLRKEAVTEMNEAANSCVRRRERRTNTASKMEGRSVDRLHIDRTCEKTPHECKGEGHRQVRQIERTSDPRAIDCEALCINQF